MTIVLIGPPAAGKTRIGRRLAKRLGLPFVDTDAVIVAQHGPIPGIFAEHGEPHFRALERVAVAESIAEPGVVSLGGGAVLDPETQSDLAATTVVLLTVQADAIASRISNAKRPLVTDLESWKRLVAARSDLYNSLADYTADTSTRPIETIVEEIAAWVEEGHR
ncbi:shikimate kinase [Leifsonia poae]|uniref:shikimate kinase n=1 Tax=Leifsonia poae TaxID=110933 RepID=UPI0022F2694A|nr:shikimate kinase [Leifsonia poae]